MANRLQVGLDIHYGLSTNIFRRHEDSWNQKSGSPLSKHFINAASNVEYVHRKVCFELVL